MISTSRSTLLGTVAALCGALMGVGALGQTEPARGRALELRMGVEQLRNPYWYEARGQRDEAGTFWDREHWERVLKGWADDGYNALLYWPEPWTETAWPSFLIAHRKYPEARELTPEQASRVIEQVKWIFATAHKHGLKNFLFDYQAVTTRPFAKAHGLGGERPVSASVDFRHNLKGEMGPAFGVRNELTRAFTEEAIAELFQTYADLDGLDGGMGEALPGKRSTWFREAVAPGLKRSGRKPVALVMNWMLPLDDFLDDVAPAAVYDNTWVSVHANVEMFTDPRPYPMALRWAERAGKPTVFEIVHHNHEAGLPFNSPRLAWEVVREYRKVENCKGFLAWFLRYDPNYLFRKALGYYGRDDVPYSDEPWLALLEERFGDREAARHFLKAYDASARIPGEVTALAWVPHDLGTSRLLLLPYWYWTEEDPRWGEMVSPARAGVLLPVRHYARVVARLGDAYRDNSGADGARNREHPGAQELIWGLGDYPITPEAHMGAVRRLGETARKEAEEGLKAVRKNRDEAVAVADSMRAYQLLTDYYERKVLAASCALIYGFGGPAKYRSEAERHADEAVALYEKAATFLWEKIDQKKGRIKGRWDGRELTLPELIEREKKERSDLAKLFKWPGEAEDRGRAVRVLIETEKGDIDVELDAARAPVTVSNFLRYVDGHYYDGGRFHRTVKPDNQPDDKVKIEVIQAGINPDAGKKEFPPIKLERTRDTKLAHKDGTISMARNGPDTATSDFFICIGDQPELDFGGKRNPDGQGFAAFGRVVKGMDVVKKIQSARADGQELKPPVKIIKVTRRR